MSLKAWLIKKIDGMMVTMELLKSIKQSRDANESPFKLMRGGFFCMLMCKYLAENTVINNLVLTGYLAKCLSVFPLQREENR